MFVPRRGRRLRRGGVAEPCQSEARVQARGACSGGPGTLERQGKGAQEQRYTQMTTCGVE